MAKKDIGKILTTGSAKQRALIYWEDAASRRFSKGNLLTDSDRRLLSESFVKSNEIKLWNKFVEANRTVVAAITNLQGFKFEALMNYSNLRGYIFLWNATENTELLVNSVLHEIKDLKERKRIAKDKAKNIRLLFSKAEPDEEGYLDIKVDFERDSYKDENGKRIPLTDQPRKTKELSLWYLMNNVKKEVENSMIRYVTYKTAIEDYMEDEGFNIKTYNQEIIEISKDLYYPIIGWDKYSGELRKGYLPHPRLEEIIKKYAICPHIRDIKPDEELYHHYRRHSLDGSDYQQKPMNKTTA